MGARSSWIESPIPSTAELQQCHLRLKRDATLSAMPSLDEATISDYVAVISLRGKSYFWQRQLRCFIDLGGGPENNFLGFSAPLIIVVSLSAENTAFVN